MQIFRFDVDSASLPTSTHPTVVFVASAAAGWKHPPPIIMIIIIRRWWSWRSECGRQKMVNWKKKTQHQRAILIIRWLVIMIGSTAAAKRQKRGGKCGGVEYLHFYDFRSLALLLINEDLTWLLLWIKWKGGNFKIPNLKDCFQVSLLN